MTKKIEYTKNIVVSGIFIRGQFKQVPIILKKFNHTQKGLGLG